MSRRDDQATTEGSLLALDQYMRSLRWTSFLREDEEQLFIQQVQQGKGERTNARPDERVLAQVQVARDRLVEGYQALVVSIAKKYVRLCCSLELLDLVQEGNIGLLQALTSYDPGKDHTLGAFAAVCIRCAVLKAIFYRDELIRVPCRAREESEKLGQVEREFEAKSGRSPSSAEVAEMLEVSQEKVRGLAHVQHCRQVRSLEGLLHVDDAEDRHEFVSLFQESERADGRGSRQFEVVLQAMQTHLTLRQREAIWWRYGLDGEVAQERTHPQVGALLGCSASSASIAEYRGREKLRRLLDEVSI